MGKSSTLEIPAFEYLEKRIKRPIEGRIGSDIIGLGGSVVGVHGTDIDSVIRLARDGQFSGGNEDLDGTFHLTPNLQFKGWKKTGFYDDVERVKRQLPVEHPIEIAKQYAENGGVVLTFGSQVLELVRTVDIDELRQEPEVVLHQAPAIDSIYSIFPYDEESDFCLRQSLSKVAISSVN